MSSQEREKQIQELDEWIKSNPDSRELKRILAVKLVLQGWLYKAIAELLKVSPSFISKYKKRFKEAGIEGLKLSYQGGKSYLSKEEKQEVIDWLQEQECWDISELECYLVEQYGVEFKSLTSYYELISEAKINWQKAQKKNSLQERELVKKRTRK